MNNSFLTLFLSLTQIHTHRRTSTHAQIQRSICMHSNASTRYVLIQAHAHIHVTAQKILTTYTRKLHYIVMDVYLSVLLWTKNECMSIQINYSLLTLLINSSSINLYFLNAAGKCLHFNLLRPWLEKKFLLRFC